MFGGWTCSARTPGPQGPIGLTGPQGPVGQAPRYANVVVVAKSGGDFSDPVAALASIVDASATNRYLVKIMPGEYRIGAWLLKSYVDIEGSGTGVTSLLAADGYLLLSDFSMVGVEIRALTLLGSAEVLWVRPGAAMTLSDVVIACDPNAAAPNCSRVTNYGGTLVLKNVIMDAVASGDATTQPLWIADPSGSVEMCGGQCRTPAEAGCLVGTGQFRAAGVRFAGGPVVNPHYPYSGAVKSVGCFTADFDPIP